MKPVCNLSLLPIVSSKSSTGLISRISPSLIDPVPLQVEQANLLRLPHRLHIPNELQVKHCSMWQKKKHQCLTAQFVYNIFLIILLQNLLCYVYLNNTNSTPQLKPFCDDRLKNLAFKIHFIIQKFLKGWTQWHRIK